MKKVTILQKQHFLKKNYIYNFLRSSINFNKFFLKNNLFFVKFVKFFKYFLHINFFFKKTSILFNNNILYAKSNSVFINNKYKNNIYIDLYGISHINTIYKDNNYLKNNVFILKNIKLKKCLTNFEIFNYNYNFLYGYNIFINILFFNKIY